MLSQQISHQLVPLYAATSRHHNGHLNKINHSSVRVVSYFFTGGHYHNYIDMQRLVKNIPASFNELQDFLKLYMEYNSSFDWKVISIIAQ